MIFHFCPPDSPPQQSSLVLADSWPPLPGRGHSSLRFCMFSGLLGKPLDPSYKPVPLQGQCLSEKSWDHRPLSPLSLLLPPLPSSVPISPQKQKSVNGKSSNPDLTSNLKMELITAERRKASKADKETKITKIPSILFLLWFDFYYFGWREQKDYRTSRIGDCPFLAGISSFWPLHHHQTCAQLGEWLPKLWGPWLIEKKAKLYRLLTTPKHNNTRYTLNVEDKKELINHPNDVPLFFQPVSSPALLLAACGVVLLESANQRLAHNW